MKRFFLLALVNCGDATITTEHDASTLDVAVSDAATDVVMDVTHDITAPDAGDDADADIDTGVDAGFDCSAPLVTDMIVAGTPPWKLAEASMYVANIEPASAFYSAIEDVVSPTHKYNATYNLFTSVQAHGGPYGSELAKGMAASPYTTSGCFSLSDVTSPKGLVLLLNLVPSGNAMTGKSFEQSNGPVFYGPVVDGNLYEDKTNTLIDPDFDGQVFDAQYVYNDSSLNGYSHVYLQFGENQTFVQKPLAAGMYRYEILVRDGSGTQRTMTKVWFKLQ